MKNVKLLLLSTTLVTLCFGNLRAHNPLKSRASHNNVHLNRSVTALPVVSPFLPEYNAGADVYKSVMDIYKSTWNNTLTKRENLENLADRFLDECVESFEIIVKQKNGIYLCCTDSGKNFVFGNNVAGVAPINNSEKIQIVAKSSVNTSADIIVPSWRVPMFLQEAPLSFTPTLKEQLREALLQLVQNPVGAKLLRVLISKHTVNHMSKLVFIPTRSIDVIELQAGDVVQRYLAQENQEIANYLKNNMKDRFVLYNPDYPLDKNKRIIRYNSQIGNCVLDKKDVPFRVSLFNILNHSLHESGSRYSKENSLIQRRSNDSESVLILKKEQVTEEVVVPTSQTKRDLYLNDTEYRNMMGFTPSGGIDLLCEAAYTSKENTPYIRMSSRKWNGKTKVKGIINIGSVESSKNFQQSPELTQTQVDEIFLQYIEKGGDGEVYKAFLNHEYKSPKFGIGQYECSDLDPKTGEELNSTEN